MRWWKPAPSWPVDPYHVELGSVSLDGAPAVNVRYRGRPAPECVAADLFCARTRRSLESGRPLEIEWLRVSPRTRRRYAAFFDSLTDWGPATERALRSRPDGSRWPRSGGGEYSLPPRARPRPASR